MLVQESKSQLILGWTAGRRTKSESGAYPSEKIC